MIASPALDMRDCDKGGMLQENKGVTAQHVNDFDGKKMFCSSPHECNAYSSALPPIDSHQYESTTK